MVKKYGIVVAMCNNRGIGKDGTLPWRLKKDMDFFRKITSDTKDTSLQNAVIMGRKTWESIPEKFRPLRNRINIILSTTMSSAPKNTYLSRNLNEAIDLIDSSELCNKIENVFVIGGSSVYGEMLCSSLLSRIYLTRVLAEFECDTFLPEIDMAHFRRVDSPENITNESQEENSISFNFEVYDRC